MPIKFDGFDPVYTNQSFKTILPAGGIRVKFFINVLTGLLIDWAGWTLLDNIQAKGSVSYPLGAPYVSGPGLGPPHTVNCDARAPFLIINSFVFKYFIPGSETPGTGTCIWFPLGFSPIDTLNNLASVVSGNTPYIASVSTTLPTGFRMSLTAALGGPNDNFPIVMGDGQFGAAAPVDGGGFLVQSAVGLLVTIKGLTGGFGGSTIHDGRVSFDFSFGGNTVKDFRTDVFPVGFDTQKIKQFNMVANPYGFCFFDPDSDSHPFIGTSMLVMSPAVTSNFVPVTPVAFVVGAGGFRQSTNWNGATAGLVGGGNNGIIVSIGGGINQLSGYPPGGGAYPRPLCMRIPTNPLLSYTGRPLSQCAYIMMGGSQPDLAHVLGKMWDCVMVNDYYPGPMKMSDGFYESISAQPGTSLTTRSSLLWRYDQLVHIGLG